MTIKNEIWILADQRVGTFSQSIGLAKELVKQKAFDDYRIINLNYSLFSCLPNFLLGESTLGITSSCQKKIADFNYSPSLIISAGRRSASVALYLKKISSGKTKVIQIMKPELPYQKFDFVILPSHDSVKEKNDSSILTSIGSLNKITDQLLAHEKEKFREEFSAIKKTKLAVLLGGSSNKTNFTKKSAIKLAKKVSLIAKNMDAKLLILNSRRTGDNLTEAFKSSLDKLCDYSFFDWKEIAESNKNPYLAILACSDFFVITGDSVSMISECCFTQKPVYIFDEEEISSPKYRKFHQSLFEKNYAKKLEENFLTLEKFLPQKLDETQRIAKVILDKF